MHERPINSKCQHVKESDNSDQESDTTSGAEQMNINRQILNELKQLNGRIAKVEEKVESQDKGHVNSPMSFLSARNLWTTF